jgi:hypothetical protein
LVMIKNDSEPNVVEIQEGFTWPYFVINHTVREDLEFPPNMTGLWLYHPLLSTWTKIKDNHIITVEDNAHVFLKAPDVVDCKDFGRHAQSPTQNVPHFHHDLRSECAYVKSTLEAKSTSSIHAKATVKHK